MGGMKVIKDITSIETKDFIYSMDGLIAVNVIVKGIENQGEEENLPAGTLLGRVSEDNTYNIYDNTAEDGREVAVGILLNDIRGLNEGDEVNAVILVKGAFVKSRLTGYDDGALADLNGREIVLDDNKSIIVI